MRRSLCIWLRAGWRPWASGANGQFLTNGHELVLVHPNGRVEGL